MKIFVLLFLSFVVSLNLNSQLRVQSTDKWQLVGVHSSNLDSSNTGVFSESGDSTVVFKGVGETINESNGYCWFQTVYSKTFSLFQIPDTVGFFCKKDTETSDNVRVFLAVQDVHAKYYFLGIEEKYVSNEWTTLKWSMEKVKEFGIDSVYRLYLIYITWRNNPAHINIQVSADNMVGIGSTLLLIDDFGSSTTTRVKPKSEIVKGFNLFQNYPNPFNPSTKIRFSLPSESYTTLKVYDMLGREISVLIDGLTNAGNHEISFDGSHLSSGMYLYKIQTQDFTEMRRMLLVK